MDIAIKLQTESEILKALGHPIRLQIVKGLAENECNVNKIVSKLHQPQSTISQHLALLKNKGIIQGTKNGVSICYKVCNDKVNRILKALD